MLLEGQYGIGDVYMSVPAVLGRGGVLDIPELELDDEELGAVRASAATVAEAFAALGAAGLARWWTSAAIADAVYDGIRDRGRHAAPRRARGARARGAGASVARAGAAVLEQLLENAEDRRRGPRAAVPGHRHRVGVGRARLRRECLGEDLQPDVDDAVRRAYARRRACA